MEKQRSPAVPRRGPEAGDPPKFEEWYGKFPKEKSFVQIPKKIPGFFHFQEIFPKGRMPGNLIDVSSF
jgi:hypothetical protein